MLGPQMVRDGWLRFQPKKTSTSTGDFLEIPVLPALAAQLPNKTDQLNYLVTEFGKPFTADGFGNKFGRWCEDAGLPHCSAHGLRKAGATFATENGATDSQLKAMFGWRSAKMAAHYTRKAESRNLLQQSCAAYLSAYFRRSAVRDAWFGGCPTSQGHSPATCERIQTSVA
jgi:integrase